ncbi:MAG: hypothetical protein HQ523_03070 [Lentisphaerae bacterium]|nr:hypothetical protein [Lentisphaerota bacterium]
MARKVLDSWSILSFLEDTPAAEGVERLLLTAESGKVRPVLLLGVVSWTEIYYSVAKAASQNDAERTMLEISELPIQLVALAEQPDILRQAAIYRLKGLPNEPAFAAALARTMKAELVTGNPCFKAVTGEFRIRWLKEDA